MPLSLVTWAMLSARMSSNNNPAGAVAHTDVTGAPMVVDDDAHTKLAWTQMIRKVKGKMKR